VFRSGGHTHPASCAKAEARIAVNSMRDAVHAGCATSTRELIACATQPLQEEARSQLQNINTLSRTIQNWRPTALGYPALPACRTGYEIPDSFKYLADGSSFLAFDSGIDDVHRILIFATDSGLDELSTSNSWACDGTFKAAPNLWTQLFTVHAVINDSCLPRVFALLPNKQEATYRRLFSAIFNLRPNSRPVQCIMDFEIAVHTAFTTVFHSAVVSGCLFHFGQSCWGKICQIGKKKKEQYNNDPSFGLKIKCFSGLAFLPLEDVVDAFELLSDDEVIPAEFITYFEGAYIGIQRGRGERRRRVEPLFPIEVWNVRERTLNDQPRTNNAVEGFHSALRASITSMHPNLWKLCVALQKKEALTQTKLLQVRRGDELKTKKNTRL